MKNVHHKDMVGIGTNSVQMLVIYSIAVAPADWVALEWGQVKEYIRRCNLARPGGHALERLIACGAAATSLSVEVVYGQWPVSALMNVQRVK